MKINFVLPSIGNSGGINVVNTYVELLIEAGHDVVVYKEILSPNMHRYRSHLKNVTHQAWCSLKAVKEIKRKKNYDHFVLKISEQSVRGADATIATSWPTAFEVAKLPENHSKKWYFIQGFETWDNHELGLESYKLSLNKIVISTWINKQLKEHLGIGPFPVLFNGIDLELFKPIDEKASNRKKRQYSKSILMLNHDNPVKGVDDGLKVIERIRREYPSTRFVMFGLRDKANLPGYIDYIQNPDTNTLVNLYQQSDIFLFPSHSDGWGLTPIEAMASGCAVVGTNTGFVLDLGNHEENMMICEPGDIDGMVTNVKILMKNADMLQKIKKNGRATAELLSWNISLEKLIKILGSD